MLFFNFEYISSKKLQDFKSISWKHAAVSEFGPGCLIPFVGTAVSDGDICVFKHVSNPLKDIILN